MKECIRLAAFAALTVLTSMTALASAVAAQACHGARRRPSKSNVGAVAATTLCIVNQVRRAHHLSQLRMNSVLRDIAAGQSHDMRVGGYFGDNSLSGMTPMQRIAASSYAHGSRRLVVSQNIAWGKASESTPAAIVRAWMQSPPHREILLAPEYREVGVGVSLGTPRRAVAPGAIYTLDLAARRA